MKEPEEAELENGDKVFAFDIVTEQMLNAELLKAETKKMFEHCSTMQSGLRRLGNLFRRIILLHRLDKY